MERSKAIKNPIAGLVALMIIASALTFSAVAANGAEEKSAELLAAETLNGIGLFDSFGNGPEDPDFALGRTVTRLEGIAMLVQLMGAQGEALSGDYSSPFEDLPDWGAPYAGYAYEMGWVKGVSNTHFDPDSTMTPTQYLTLLLHALGYRESVDFTWYAAWELTDALGITGGEFGAASNTLIRGDIAYVSLLALNAQMKDSGQTLLGRLIEVGVFEKLAEAGLVIDEAIIQALASGGLEAIPDDEYLEIMDAFEESFNELLSEIFNVMWEFMWESDYAYSEDDLDEWRRFYYETVGEAEGAIDLLEGIADRVPGKYQQAHSNYIMTAQWVFDVLTTFNDVAETAAQGDEEVLIEAMNVFLNGMLQANETWLMAKTSLASIVYQESIS